MLFTKPAAQKSDVQISPVQKNSCEVRHLKINGRADGNETNRKVFLTSVFNLELLRMRFICLSLRVSVFICYYTPLFTEKRSHRLKSAYNGLEVVTTMSKELILTKEGRD